MQKVQPVIEKDKESYNELRREMTIVKEKRSEHLIEKVRELNTLMYEIQTKKPNCKIVDEMLERCKDGLKKRSLPFYTEWQIRAGLHEVGFGCPYTGMDYELLWPKKELPELIDGLGEIELPDYVIVEGACSECGRLAGYFHFPRNLSGNYGILYGDTSKVNFEKEVKTWKM
jgi:hypothetical protein